MPGSRITRKQEEMYMKNRQTGQSQDVAAAKSGVSVRSGRRIERGERIHAPRTWRTREDPLGGVWETHLAPLLAQAPDLTGLTLLEYLEDTFPGDYDGRILRTLQRRVQHWKAVHGPDKAVIFRQQAEPGRQGLSDFTHVASAITLAGQPFVHLLYQFRLAFSGWRHVQVVQGGESYAALSEGLQGALRQLGGCPGEHRTDSLSAAFDNLTGEPRARYEALCQHYGMTPTHNNPGASHENGAIETAHGSLKRRLSQALKVRGSADFASVDAYQQCIDRVVGRLNRRVATRLGQEQAVLQPLPDVGFASYTELVVKVTRSATIEVRRVLYSVPSRLVGSRLRVHLYQDRLVGYLGTTRVVTLPRIHAHGQQRLRQVDYRHVIHGLAAKPQAFRYSRLRDDLLPNDRYRRLWRTIDHALPAREACKWMVGVLRIAADHDCEAALIDDLEPLIAAGEIPTLHQLQARYLPSQPGHDVPVTQHALADYDRLLSSQAAVTVAEVHHG